MNFVTGGTGLVGSHLIYDLLLKGEKVRALKRSTSNIQQLKKTISYYESNPDFLFNKVEWIDGNVLDFYSICDALKDVKHVYHCAAIVSFDPKKRNELIRDNVQGTANLVNASLDQKIDKFCHVSSVSALGRTPAVKLVTEEGVWVDSKNKSAYAISKHLSEMEVWRGIAEGLNSVIVNPSIILGPGNWENGSSKMFTSIYKGLRFYTKGIIGYVDVRDVSMVMVKLMECEISAGRFILNSENLSYEYVFKLIGKSLGVKNPDIYAKRWISELGWRFAKIRGTILNKPALITKETARTAHKSVQYSSQKIREQLNFSFIPINQSIKEISSLFLKDFN